MTTRYPVVHFEMPYDDQSRAATFYEQAFGWGTQKFGPEMGGYVTAATTDTDAATGRPTVPGNINGGLFPRDPERPAQVPSVVIGVDDIAAVSAKVAEAGGEVLGDPIEIPGVGLYVSFLDTEGNRVSLLQPGGGM